MLSTVPSMCSTLKLIKVRIFGGGDVSHDEVLVVEMTVANWVSAVDKHIIVQCMIVNTFIYHI